MWMELIEEHVGADVVKVLVEKKIDLKDDRDVSEEGIPARTKKGKYKKIKDKKLSSQIDLLDNNLP